MNLPSLDCLAHFQFGEGKVLVQQGLIDDAVPALILSHAEYPGTPGGDASKKERSAEHPDVLEKSVVLTFKTEAQRDAVALVLMGSWK
jgi:hypothetical protein